MDRKKGGEKKMENVPYELRGLTPFQQRNYLKMIGRWDRSYKRHNSHKRHKGGRRKP